MVERNVAHRSKFHDCCTYLWMHGISLFLWTFNPSSMQFKIHHFDFLTCFIHTSYWNVYRNFERAPVKKNSGFYFTYIFIYTAHTHTYHSLLDFKPSNKYKFFFIEVDINIILRQSISYKRQSISTNATMLEIYTFYTIKWNIFPLDWFLKYLQERCLF